MLSRSLADMPVPALFDVFIDVPALLLLSCPEETVRADLFLPSWPPASLFTTVLFWVELLTAAPEEEPVTVVPEEVLLRM